MHACYGRAVRGGVHVVVAAGALLLGAACSSELRAEGEPCFASSECAAGLVCDLAAEPSVCRMGGAGGMTPEPDAAPGVDAAPGIDAAPRPDGAPEPDPPDAAPPDAAPPDAAPPDAAPPDAAI